MNITLLTSSRADYGIYLPLLKKLNASSFFNLQLVVFGTHTSKKYGYTIDQILKDGFNIKYTLDTLPNGDSALAIAKCIGNTTEKFAQIWEEEKNTTELIICLGDRYEMFAAVSAAIPFNIPIAHIHGGETTAGAIDNYFRHAITCMSLLHFTSTENHANKVIEITGNKNNVYNVGALGLDNLNDITLLTKDEFKTRFNIILDSPVLVTFHPETIDYEKNILYINELLKSLDELKDQIIITMPNTDTMGDFVRQEILTFANKKNNVHVIESFGTQGYFTCLTHCKYILGNSSSGIIEAASFAKYVINIGNRQKGRDAGKNIINVDIKKDSIIAAINSIDRLPKLTNNNIYGDGYASTKIIDVLKNTLALTKQI